MEKLQFFSYVAGLLHPMLLKYQTNWAMISFYFQDFISLVKDLMRICGKPEILDTFLCEKELQKFDFAKKKNQLSIGSATVGFDEKCTFKRSQKERYATNR